MWISIGKSRKDTHWKNIQLTWPELVQKLKKPIKTSETVLQYSKLPKEKRDEIKDVGGYVGGTIKGGNRVKENIECRTLLTLEGDEDCTGLWETFTLLFDCSAFLHTTHSSTPDKLRVRLIIPLSRECFTEEYEAIIRKIAETLGMDYFDPTTFQAIRLMYWPSISKDAEYIYKEQTGAPLQVDEILKEYRDWKDQSQWPLHPNENKKLNTAISKQESPLTKEGIIGAFCRTYGIHEAIEKFLPKVYESTDIENRYTYKAGSTTAGVITYEDLFSYSHHSTDPTSGLLCNAFDLVRLSLFSDLDSNTEEETGPSKKPSFIKCCEFLLKDKKVKKALVGDKIKEAKNDFNGIVNKDVSRETGEAPEPEEEADITQEDWYSSLETDKKGNVIYSTVNNIVLILENDKKFKDVFRWDAFSHRMIVDKSTYWKKVTSVNDMWLDDNDKANIRHYLEKMYGISGKDKVNDALLIVAYKNKFHPVKDYLAGLQWDNTKRLDSLLIDYLGAEDNAYTRAVTRKTFVAAIARVMQPGIKFDTMLILVGKQGMGKSTILNKLAGAWFSDNVGNLHDKSSMEQLRGIWLMEIGELASLKKADIDTIKGFLSRKEDRFRQAFGETLSNFPRQCVFIGTTNEDEFLIDTTGNRRFWPVVLHKKRDNKNVFKIADKDIAQLWAEALYYYNQEEPLHLNEEVNIIAEKIQEEHTEKESYLPIIQAYLNKPIPEDWYKLTPSEKYSYMQGDGSDFGEKQEAVLVTRYKITAVEIWLEALNGRKENFDKIKAKSIKNAMRKLGEWEYKKIKVDTLATWGWMKKTQG